MQENIWRFVWTFNLKGRHSWQDRVPHLEPHGKSVIGKLWPAIARECLFMCTRKTRPFCLWHCLLLIWCVLRFLRQLHRFARTWQGPIYANGLQKTISAINMRLIIIFFIFFDIITVITIAILKLKVLINMIITIKDIVKQLLTLGELSMRLFEYFPQMRNSSPHPNPPFGNRL